MLAVTPGVRFYATHPCTSSATAKIHPTVSPMNGILHIRSSIGEGDKPRRERDRKNGGGGGKERKAGPNSIRRLV